MAHGVRRLIAELTELDRAKEIDQQLPTQMKSEFTSALFLLIQSSVDAQESDCPDSVEWFASESSKFLSIATGLIDGFGGKSSTACSHRLIDGLENSRCFWFQDPPTAAIAAAQAVQSLIEEHAVRQKARVRLGIGRHGYASSNVALNANADAIGFDSVLWKKIPTDEQLDLRRMVVSDPKINRRGFQRAFERYVSQNAPELVGHHSE